MVNMCGRYVLFSTQEELVAVLQRRVGGSRIGAIGDVRPSYNVAPTHTVPIARRFRESVALGPAAWGYPPKTVFNARGETAMVKPLFAGSFPCAVPMDGWYEWTREENGGKQPWFTRREDSDPLFMAGLCKVIEGRLYATVITTAAAPQLEWLHHRMPWILVGDELGEWLGGVPEARAAEMVASTPTVDGLVSVKADRRVGNVAHNGPELLRG